MTAANAVAARLTGLPAKVAAPLADLLSTGLVQPATVDAVLDAGELAGAPQHLLGFAVAMLDMERDRVPVTDTVRMARQQGRKLNLRWSRKRWHDEHNRLSRAATLARLNAADAIYDLADYERHLPARWPGYLIRTSRRLGMEGLRQRHCVSAYHSMIRNGSRAIAVVFVDRRRWTVELWKTHYGANPLAVGQISGVLNRPPTREVRAAVFEVLGLEDTRLGSRSAREHTYMDNLRELLPVLREQRIEKVYASFSGYGDSGQIDEVSFRRAGERVRLPGVTVNSRVGEYAHDHQTGEWRQEGLARTADIDDAVRTLTDDYLEETGVDYYNDSGGHGELVIHVDEGTVELEVNQTVEHSECAFHAKRDIASGEAIA